MAITIPCAFCSTPFMSKPSQASKRRCCSRACVHALRTAEVMAAWQSKVGAPIGEWLRRRYLDENASFRDLMADLALSEVRVLSKVMRLHDIPLRRGSAAVRTQWIDAGERRMNAAATFREVTAPHAGRFAHGREASPRELVVMRWLVDCGVRVEQQRLFHFERLIVPIRRTSAYTKRVPHYVDLFLPELWAGIEVYGSVTNLRPVRHSDLSKLGVRMFYVPNRVVDRGERSGIDKLISTLKRFRIDPSTADDVELVRWGYPEGAPRLQDHLDEKRAA